MPYSAYGPFQSPHRARLPEQFTQAGVLLTFVAVAAPLAVIDRLFGRAARERQPTLTSVLERHS